MESESMEYYCPNCGKKSNKNFKNDKSNKKEFLNLVLSRFMWFCSDKCDKQFTKTFFDKVKKIEGEKECSTNQTSN